MTQTESSATDLSAEHGLDRNDVYHDEMQSASDQVRADLGARKVGVVLTNETLRCACGNETKITGTIRVMRGTDIHCGACGLPLVVFGPTVIDVEQQRDELLRMLRKFASPAVVLRSIFRNRSAAVAELVGRISEQKKRPYGLTVHRRTST
jgi:hypothetical protein